jgi:hypothetical protein
MRLACLACRSSLFLVADRYQRSSQVHAYGRNLNVGAFVWCRKGVVDVWRSCNRGHVQLSSEEAVSHVAELRAPRQCVQAVPAIATKYSQQPQGFSLGCNLDRMCIVSRAS